MTEVESVYYAVRTGFWYNTYMFRLKEVKALL